MKSETTKVFSTHATERQLNLAKEGSASRNIEHEPMLAWNAAADWWGFTESDMRNRLYISADNKKLKKTGTVSFNLPAVFSCPRWGLCAGNCYATKGHYMMRTVEKTRLENMYWLATHSLVEFTVVMAAMLKGEGHVSCRPHDSGDFWSQGYVNAWKEIATLCPEIHFHCYTKTFHKFDFSEIRALKNFSVVQSEGGKDDKHIDYALPHARVFKTVEEMEKAGYANGSYNDAAAMRGEVRIGLVWH